MKVVHFAQIIDPHHRINGISVSVGNLSPALSRIDGITVYIVHTTNNREPAGTGKVPVFDNASYLKENPVSAWPVELRDLDVAVFNSVYVFVQAGIARQLVKANIPYIICPRGGMTQEALSTKRLKKWLGDIYFFDRFVREANELHFLTEEEKRVSTRWAKPSFVIGNGTNVPPLAETKKFQPGSICKMMILGRLKVYHKGLDLALEAIGRVKESGKVSNLEVSVYGPECSEGDSEILRKLVEKHCFGDTVVFRGPVHGDDKMRAFQEADVFLQTSRSEGHPSSVIEALAYGLPTIVTPGTNMADVVSEEDCGWVTEPDATLIADCICEAMNSSYEEIEKKSRNARSLAERHFDWSSIAERVASEYERIIRR